MGPKAMATRNPLLCHEGNALFQSTEAILKAVLEADQPVDLVIGSPDSWFRWMLRLLDDDETVAALREHGTRVRSAGSASRAVTLARHAALAGRRALAIVGGDELPLASDAISQAITTGAFTGACMLLVEDDPQRAPWPAPRGLLAEIDIACLEPSDVGALRASVETGLYLSRASSRPVAGIVHASIVRTIETLPCHPNRVVRSVDVAAVLRRRRRRRFRAADDEGLLRVARRLEVNRQVNLPSPGEREHLGFILVGPALAALRHLLNQLQLTGRVPLLELGLVHPLDDASIERFLERCEHAVVLEPRIGLLSHSLLQMAEGMRREGKRPALIWSERLPPGRQEERGGRLAADEATSPSILARRLIDLLHAVRPARRVATHLFDELEAPQRPGTRTRSRRLSATDDRIHAALRDVAAWLATRAPLAENDLAPSTLIVDGVGPESQRTIRTEVWDGRRFLLEGRAAVQQAARDEGPWVFVVSTAVRADASSVERYSEAIVPAEHVSRIVIETVEMSTPLELQSALRRACLRNTVSVLIASDDERRIDGRRDTETAADIDRQGFRRHDEMTQQADAPCNVRRMPGEAEPVIGRLGHEASGGVFYSFDRLPARLRKQVRIRIRPLLEVAEVVRSKPPLVSLRSDRGGRLPLPQAVHGGQPIWRIHFAGVRGDAPGIAARIVCDAGRAQGYDVRSIFNPQSIGAARSAWSQVLFAQWRDDGSPLPLTTRIPFGEADVLLGADAHQVVRACAGEPMLQVAHPSRTYAVHDAGFSEELDEAEAAVSAPSAEELLKRFVEDERRLCVNASEAARTTFGSDRPADLILLGFSFQHGLIPVTVESMDVALAAAEERGYGRCRDAFQFGRQLATGAAAPRLLRRTEEADAEHVFRRARLALYLEGGRLRRSAADFSRIVREALEGMPGLGESELGRVARREFVLAMERCLRWGGTGYARQYRDAIVALYAADRGDRARALTRSAVLPLAEVMLIRDSAFVGVMSMSLEARRLVRQRLNAKPSRGDEVSRRFLNRFEAIAAGHRLRIDFRTSDWTMPLAARLGRIVPNRWRGTGVERERRDYVLDLLQRASAGAASDYDRWALILRRLHDAAAAGQLRHFSARALRHMLEPTHEDVGGAEPDLIESDEPVAAEETQSIG